MSSPRIAPLPQDEWDDDVAGLFKGGSFVGDGKILNVFSTLAHHPKLLKRWLVFATHVLGKSTLDARTREILILRTGWLCGSPYEWGQHVVIGRAAGITDAEIGDIAVGPSSINWSPGERQLLVAADELFEHRTLTDGTFSALAQAWTTEQVMDLVFTVGQYQLVATALNSFRVQRDDDVEGVPFPEPAGV